MVMPPPPAPEIAASAPPSQSSSSAGGYVGPDHSAEMIVTAVQRRNDVPVARSERSTESAEIKFDLADLTTKRPYVAALASATAGDRLTVLRSQEQA